MTPIYGGSAAQLDYRLIQQHGCAHEDDAQFGYRTDLRERPLRWIGAGLAEHGLVDGAELTEAGFDKARLLVAGRDPNAAPDDPNGQLVAPKLAIPADAKVSSAELVDAVNAAAHEAGVTPAQLLARNKKNVTRFARLGREVASKGAAARTRADHAGAIAVAAGLDGEAVWGPGVHATAVANLTETVTVTDPKTGATVTVTVPRRVDVGLRALGLELGLPKSYSTLLAVLPEQVAQRLEGRFGGAVGTVFTWGETRTSYVLRGQHGEGKTAQRIESTGYAGWVMVHRTARPVEGQRFGDPHWHVHITIPHMVRGVDGQWSTPAAGGRELMRHAHVLDKLLQAEARATLSEEFGIEFARSTRTGLWEVKHVPDVTILLFSKRGIDVRGLLKELGYEPGQATAATERRLTRGTRSAKDHSTAAADETLREHWQQQMRDANPPLLANGEPNPDYDPARVPEVMSARVLANFVAAGGVSTDPDATQRIAQNVINAGMDGGVGAAAGAAQGTVSGLVPVEVMTPATVPIVTVAAVAQALADPDTGLTADKRRFSRLDALAAVADELPTGAHIADIETMTDLVLVHPAFKLIGAAGLKGTPGEHTQLGAAHMTDPELFTTVDIPEAERAIIATVARSVPSQNRAVVDERTRLMSVSVVEAEQGFALSEEQRQVLAEVLSNGRAVEAIEGPPGTGKTTLMRAARVSWESCEYRVAGAATAAVAAQTLATESGIPSMTVAGWLKRIREGDGFTGIDVFVLDEANLTDDRARMMLYAEADRCGTKIVEVGDPVQLRGVGCGSLFGYIHALLGGPKLTENRRQADEDARRILDVYRSGRYAEAFQALAQGGRLVATETADEALVAMVSEWMRRSAGADDGHQLARGLVMLAHSNEQVARINNATQATREQTGQLGPGAEFTTQGGARLRFCVGDQVLIRRNDRTHTLSGRERTDRQVEGDSVLNGYRGMVTGVSNKGVLVEWHTAAGDPKQALCSPGYIAGDGLQLAYAITAHKAEGLTVKANWDRPDGSQHRGDVLVYGPGMNNPAAYVALSRPVGDALLFAARVDIESARVQHELGTPADQDELTARVAAALAAHAKATATNANDLPVLADLGEIDANPAEQRAVHEQQRVDQQPARQAQRAAAERAEDPGRDSQSERLAAIAARTERLHFKILETAALVGEPSEKVRAEIQARVADAAAHWQAENRPHGPLSAQQLAAETEQAQAYRDQFAGQLPELHERANQLAAAAGLGVHEQAVHERQAVLEQRVELARQIRTMSRQLDTTMADYRRAGWDAHQAETGAEKAPWYRPDVRRGETTRAEQARAEQAQIDVRAQQLRAHRDALIEQLGRDEHGHDRDPGWAIREYDNAQRTLARDLERARNADQHALAEAQQAAAQVAGRLAGSQGRLDSLQTERGHRDTWNPATAHAEAVHRAGHRIGDQLDRTDERQAQRERREDPREIARRMIRNRLDRDDRLRHDYGARHDGPSQGQGHGPGMGM